VCIGGGGLLSGCAIAAKALRPEIRIFGVEPADANDTYLSFRARSRVEIPMPLTVADGLRATMPGELTFPIIQKHVEDIVLVSDKEIRETMRFLLTRMKMLVEPSGAVAAAALFHHKLPPGLGKTGAIVSGGNVDLEFFQTIWD
jgi:threonine dehydratase